MNYKKVDFSTWPRGDLFQFYMDHMRVVMSLTVDMDVTPLVRFVRQRGMKFYPAMIWVVSRVINTHEEFKLGWDQDGNLIRWDFVSPSYAHFHREDENFTKLVTEYAGELSVFHARFLRDRERYGELRGVVGHQPPNFFDVSCLPWVRYRHFDVHVFDQGMFLAPVVTYIALDNGFGNLWWGIAVGLLIATNLAPLITQAALDANFDIAGAAGSASAQVSSRSLPMSVSRMVGIGLRPQFVIMVPFVVFLFILYRNL